MRRSGPRNDVVMGIETGAGFLAMCVCAVVFKGRAATSWRSTFGRTPDGGTKTGAGGGVVRTPEAGAEDGPCATNVGLGV
jgi:hypothetical protein